MRILIHMGDPFTDNGPNSKRMATFADAFVKNGHCVTVLTPKCEGSVSDEKIRVIQCSMFCSQNKSSLGRMVAQLSYGLFSLFSSFKAGKVDVVITTTPPALISPAGWLIAKAKKSALVYDVRDIWPDVALEMGSFKKGSIYDKWFSRVRDFMLRKSDLVTAVSPGKVKKLSDYPHKSDVIYITNGFDKRFLDNVDDKDVISKYRLTSSFTCVYVGKLGLAQGLSSLLKLASKAKAESLSARFLLFGAGVEEAALREQVEEMKLDNVEFCGIIPNAQVYTILKNADMCYVPLVNGNLTDSVPTKLYEALGCGCPVLLSARGDSVDILSESELGYSASPNDSEALWDAFMKIYSKKDWTIEKEKAYKYMTTKYSRQAAAEKMSDELARRFDN